MHVSHPVPDFCPVPWDHDHGKKEETLSMSVLTFNSFRYVVTNVLPLLVLETSPGWSWTDRTEYTAMQLVNITDDQSVVQTMTYQVPRVYTADAYCSRYA